MKRRVTISMDIDIKSRGEALPDDAYRAAFELALEDFLDPIAGFKDGLWGGIDNTDRDEIDRGPFDWSSGGYHCTVEPVAAEAKDDVRDLDD